MGQKDGEKWTAAAALQPTNSKSDRLLGCILMRAGADAAKVAGSWRRPGSVAFTD